MKTTEVYEAVGAKEEIGDDGSNGIQFGNKNEGYRNNVAENIGSIWLIVFPITFCKKYDVGVYLVLAQTLKDFWSGDKKTQGRR